LLLLLLLHITQEFHRNLGLARQTRKQQCTVTISGEMLYAFIQSSNATDMAAPWWMLSTVDDRRSFVQVQDSRQT
jgi:hypothetical protein